MNITYSTIEKPEFLDDFILLTSIVFLSIKSTLVDYYSDLLGFEVNKGFIVGVPVDSVHAKFSKNVEVQCPHCLETREAVLKTVRAADHTYCQKCSAHATYGHMVGEKFGRLLVLKINDERRLSGQVMVATCNCLCECGEFFEACCVDLLRGNTQSCICLRLERISEANTNPNLTDEERQERREKRLDYEYQRVKKFVRQRDRNTCWFCSSQGHIVHHQDDFANHEEVRTDPNNLVCVCGKCHKLFHKKTGGTHALTSRRDNFVYLTDQIFGMTLFPELGDY